MRFLGVLAFLAVSAAGALELGVNAPAAGAQRYYVDFDRGSDVADGRSPQTAWRHAPGDVAAEGVPEGVRLHGGDTLLFAAGVRYRGEIRLNGSGEPGLPVVLTSSPGAAPAIIDGSDPVSSLRPCRSAEDCGGVADWPHLARVDFAEAVDADCALFADNGLLFPAQSPNPKDLFNSDAVSEFVVADGRDLQRGVAKLPRDLARRIAGPGERRLLLEVYPNVLAWRDILSLDGDQARFDPAGLRFNTDRPEHFAVNSHPAMVSRPGQYGLLEGRRAAVVFLPKDAHSVSVARGRGGVNLNGRSFVQVRNLDFENMADSARKGPMSGIAVLKTGAGSDVVIAGNRFRNFRMPQGNGPIIVNSTGNLTIADNDIENVVFGSGMRLNKDSNVVVHGNRISRIGRTGVMLIGMDGARVEGNVIGDAVGIHGNGLSAYLANRAVRVVGNTITATTRPITYEGAAGSENDLEFTGNLLVGTPDSDSALTSWGLNKRVTIDGNVLLGGKQGLSVSNGDLTTVVTRNLMNGPPVIKTGVYQPPGVAAPVPAGWTISDNRVVSYRPGGPPAGEVGRQVADALSGSPTGAWLGLCPDLASRGAVTPQGAAVGAGLACPAIAARR
jgi:hypothetical protein